MMTGSCHCGQVTIRLKAPVTEVTSCNCSICKRSGGLWTYCAPQDVTIEGEAETDRYIWGDKTLALVRCRTCGCITHWRPLQDGASRMGINARMLDGIDLTAMPVRQFDGASM
jgi:hypothetical protein